MAEPEAAADSTRAAALLAAAALAAGAALSLPAIPQLLPYGDELHSLPTLERSFAELMGVFGRNGSGSALLVLQRVGLEVFGPSLWALRWPAAAGALGALALAFFGGRRLVGAGPAALAAFALALNPTHVFSSRFGRTYALVVFAALALGLAWWRAVSEREPRRGPYLAAGVFTALLPYLHLSAGGFAAGVAGAAALVLALEGRLLGHARALAAAVGGGVFGAYLLYLPALEPLLAFVGAKAGAGSLGLGATPDVFTLLAGGPWLGVAWALALAAACAWALAKRSPHALVPVTAALISAPALALARPVGGEWAYARYLLPGLPFALLLMAWAWCELARRARLPAPVALALGAALAAGAFAAGPQGAARVDDGPFASSYLSATGLPAFDAPWDGAPPFYAGLAAEAGPLRILEAPELWDQSRALYRNYHLQHGQDVGIGFVVRRMPAGLGGPVVRPLVEEPAGYDYLVLHRDVRREIERYWRFVAGPAWTRFEDREREPFMRHALELPVPFPPPPVELEAHWRARYGEPVYADEDLLVWKAR